MKKILITLIIVSLLPAITSAQPCKYALDKPLRFTLTMPPGARPNNPYQPIPNYNTALTAQGTGPGFPVRVARHHIIPFSVLRRFYNRVTEANLWPRIRGILIVYSSNIPIYAGSNSLDCTSSATADDLLSAGTLGQCIAINRVVHQSGIQTPAEGITTFLEFYTWLPGNLFVGPINRSDDPGDGFEDYANTVVGNRHFRLLRTLYFNMIAYADSRVPYQVADSPGSIRLLQTIMVQLSQVMRIKHVFRIYPEDWIYSHGKYHIKKTPVNDKDDKPRRHKRQIPVLYSHKDIACLRIRSKILNTIPHDEL